VQKGREAKDNHNVASIYGVQWIDLSKSIHNLGNDLILLVEGKIPIVA
jgi:hypothetical protein